MTPDRNARLVKGPAIFLVVLGAVEVIVASLLAIYVAAAVQVASLLDLYVAAAMLVVGSYSGIRLGVTLLALLFGTWGVIMGSLLIARRTVDACRAAAYWYLPTALLTLVAGFSGLRRLPGQAIGFLAVGTALLAIFAVMAAPPLPGYSSWLRKLKERNVLFVILGALQIMAAGVVFFVARSLGALPARPFAFWGAASGALLIARRTVGFCRAAAFWYLPAVLCLLVFSSWAIRCCREDAVDSLVSAVALLAIFVVMIVPLLPSSFSRSRRPDSQPG